VIMLGTNCLKIPEEEYDNFRWNGFFGIGSN
jgi:hypothetical protein